MEATMKGHVLLVDDDMNLLKGLQRLLHKEPYTIVTATSAEDALSILEGLTVQVVVSDQKMPGLSGIDFLRIVKEKYPQVLRIMLTGDTNLETAVSAINEGEIYRFFTKPCNEIDLAFAIREALSQQEVLKAGRKLLELTKMQAHFISELERQNPGISNLKRNQAGAIILSDQDADLDEVCKEAERELERSEVRLGWRKG